MKMSKVITVKSSTMQPFSCHPQKHYMCYKHTLDGAIHDMFMTSSFGVNSNLATPREESAAKDLVRKVDDLPFRTRNIGESRPENRCIHTYERRVY